MIKRMIGAIAALAVAAVIVWTAVHRDAYRSMLFDGAEPAAERMVVPAAPEPAASEEAVPEGADSLAAD